MSLRTILFLYSFVALVLTVPCCVGCGTGDNAPDFDDATHLFLEAQQALKSGDKAKAMELLDRSIAANPYQWSLLERAKLHAEAGNDAAAKADVLAGLEIDPENKDLKWLDGELKKPKERRFKTPSPSAVK